MRVVLAAEEGDLLDNTTGTSEMAALGFMNVGMAAEGWDPFIETLSQVFSAMHHGGL